MVEVIYEALINNTYPSLTVDDMCDTLGVSHLQLRSYVHHMRGKQPPVTEGLIQEILVEGYDQADAKRKYRLTAADVQQIFYRGKPSKQKLNVSLVLEKINEGWTNEDIANLMGCTTARVSQLRCKHKLSNRKKRQVLSNATKREIYDYAKTHSVTQTASFFSVSQSTVYSIMSKGA